MKNIILYILIANVFFIGGCKEQSKNQLPSLSETFRKEDKKPFGGFVAFNGIKELLENRFIQSMEDPFDVSWKNLSDFSSSTNHSLYILLTRNLITSNPEADAMMDFVTNGNDLFVAADYISANFLKKIGCNTDRDREVISEVAGRMKSTFVKSVTHTTEKIEYKYYYFPFYNSFSGYDPTSVKILGLNELGKPNYIVLFIGKGRLYLHSAPRAFSNYFLLLGNNYQYLESVISFLRPDPKNIFWDEYYKKLDIRRKHTPGSNRRGTGSGDQDQAANNFSSFKVINNNPSLRAAFWLALILLLIYVLFNMKRKQRIIEEKHANANTTLVFTETVGRLYLQRRNNKNIAEKMVTYFYEHIRNNYFLNTNNIDKEFISSLSRKSGVPPGITRSLFEIINRVSIEAEIGDNELLLLNEQIQHFYKNKT